MAADDFQAFKKMMVQRNRQLTYENLKRLQRMQIAAGMAEADTGAEGASAAEAATAPLEEEEDSEEMRQLEEALQLSRMTFVDDDPELAEALRISAQMSQEASSAGARAASSSAAPTLQPAGMTEEQLLEAAIQVRARLPAAFHAHAHTHRFLPDAGQLPFRRVHAPCVRAHTDFCERCRGLMEAGIQESIKASQPAPPPPPPPAQPASVSSCSDAPLLHDDTKVRGSGGGESVRGV